MLAVQGAFQSDRNSAEPQKNTLYVQERNCNLCYTRSQIGQNFCQGWEKRRYLLHLTSETRRLVGQGSDKA